MITIDETIECCEEMAKDLEERSKIARMADHKYAIYCKERAESNRQFAEWLKDYKRLLSSLDDIKAEIETDLSWFCYDEYGNEKVEWTEIKKIIDKHIGKETK